MQISTHLKPYLKSLEEMTTCCVTYEPLTSANTLYPCMHKVNLSAVETILAQEEVEKRRCPICRVAITQHYPDPLYRKIAEQATAFISFSKKKRKKSPQEIYFFLKENVFPLITCSYQISSTKFALQNTLSLLPMPLQRAFTIIPCMHRMYFADLDSEKEFQTHTSLCLNETPMCFEVINDIKPDHFVRGITEEILKIKSFLLTYGSFDVPGKLYHRDPYYKFSLSLLRSYLTPEEVISHCRLVSKAWKNMWQDPSIKWQQPNKMTKVKKQDLVNLDISNPLIENREIIDEIIKDNPNFLISHFLSPPMPIPMCSTMPTMSRGLK